MQEVRAAVIGIGVMGRKYAQMIAEGKAGGIAPDRRGLPQRRGAAVGKGYPAGYGAGVPQRRPLYDHAEEFDAVLVVTPHKTHPALVMQAFAHGKHVLCDKPSQTRWHRR